MLAFIIRRLLSTVLVMAIVAVFIFLLLHLSPGDPAAIIVGDNATQVQIEHRRLQRSVSRVGRDLVQVHVGTG